MKKLIEYFLDILNRRKEDELFEMSNLGQRRTGLPYVIFVNSGGEKSRHACRIKVCKGLKWKDGEAAVIQIEGGFTVRANPMGLSNHELAVIKAWVDLNYATILAYWNSEIETEDMIAAIIPYTGKI